MTNMRLLQLQKDGQIVLKYFSEHDVPPYAILSHKWEEDNEEEVTFQNMTDKVGKDKVGYRKIRFCAEQASKDNLDYFWVDTCCIDKRNDSELPEAIASMFKWYQEAARCYVYLSDVSMEEMERTKTMDGMLAFKQSRWFSRGWTLQELLAPNSVEFFTKEWNLLGDKHGLVQEVSDATGISVQVLEGRKKLFQLDYEERLSWMQHRETQKEEDRAYSLQGIFGVHIPIIYGEKEEKAMFRLWSAFHSTRSCSVDTMANRSKHRKPKVPKSPKGPDRFKHTRLMCRFYEPLVLLYTLGNAEEEYVPDTLPTKEETLYLPPTTMRRNFLRDLAYICDYDVGNDTAVAMAMQSLQNRYVLWVASNTSPSRRITSFLESRLADIKQISAATGTSRSRGMASFVTACIEFAAPQIEGDIACLIAELRRCKQYLTENSAEEGEIFHDQFYPPREY